jgi:hypothetical protein
MAATSVSQSFQAGDLSRVDLAGQLRSADLDCKGDRGVSPQPHDRIELVPVAGGQYVVVCECGAPSLPFMGDPRGAVRECPVKGIAAQMARLAAEAEWTVRRNRAIYEQLVATATAGPRR